ncbi:MAG TPA: arylamine N-acetyltransferase [Pseudonocardiaceae bacterium]|nr:arylamine N-acetyltransferase [Pseudonocardiaceae bacterium]
MDKTTAAAYLARIGAQPDAVLTPDAATLRDLCVQHIRTVPFENLDIHLGARITLTEEALVAKIVNRRRGGFCYELNGLFAALLTTLGYQVTVLSARVFDDDDAVGPPLDHMALRVDLARPWLVDVGFGRHAVHPLRLDEPGDQHDPGGVFALRPTGEFGDVDVLRDGAPVYRLEDRPRSLADFEAMCWYQQTSPDSTFTKQVICSVLRPEGRVTLSGLRLIRTTPDGRVEKHLTEAAALAAYRDIFGLTLDRLPVLV